MHRVNYFNYSQTGESITRLRVIYIIHIIHSEFVVPVNLKGGLTAV